MIFVYIMTVFMPSLSEKEKEIPVEMSLPEGLVYEDDMRIVAQYQYKNDTHTLVGTLPVSNECYSLFVDPIFSEDKKTVMLHFDTSVKRMDIEDGEEGDCREGVYSVPFSVSFLAPENVEIKTFIGEKEIPLNRIRVSDEIELNPFFEVKG